MEAISNKKPTEKIVMQIGNTKIEQTAECITLSARKILFGGEK